MFVLIILVKPRIDKEGMKNITIKAGRNQKWVVDVTGEPAPTLTWVLKNETVVNNDRIKIENIDYQTTLTITGAIRKDTGVYTLVAENASGKDEATLEFTVLGKPDAPKGPLEVTDITKKSCKLKWKKPEDDGGCPITEYEVEKMDVTTGKWVRVCKVPAKDSIKEPEVEISNLEPGSEYKFRVTAVNKEGDSEPLTTTKSIIAKNPFGKTYKNIMVGILFD